MSENNAASSYELDTQLLGRLEQDVATLERVLDGLGELTDEQTKEILATLDTSTSDDS